MTSFTLEREVDSSIDLVPGTTPIFIYTYLMSQVELRELNDQLEELLDRHLSYLVFHRGEPPVLLVKEKDGGMRLCIDYRQVNKVIVVPQILPTFYYYHIGVCHIFSQICELALLVVKRVCKDLQVQGTNFKSHYFIF